MGQTRRTATAAAALVAILTAPLAPILAQSPSSVPRPMTTREANMQSAIRQQEMIAAAARARQAASAAVVETPVQRKARLKAEKAEAKAQAAAVKAQEKQRKAAERAANPKRSSAAVNCIAGAAVGVALSLLTGRGSAVNLIAAGVGGCAAGWALGQALKGQDEKKLNTYIGGDFLERDDVGTAEWRAPESGQTIKIETVGESYQSVQHTLVHDTSVAVDTANIRVSVRKMRTLRKVSLVAAPVTGAAVIGNFGLGEFVHAYGETIDGQWIYLIDRQPDGTDLLIGYVPATSLTSALALPSAGAVALAKPRSPARPAPSKSANRRPVRPAAAVVTVKPALYVPPKKVTFAATTRCKNIRVSASGQSGATQPRCGGASNIA